MPDHDLIPGQLFVYQEKSRLFRRRSGAGQILGRSPTHDIVFVRIFNVSGDDLAPFIDFLPITLDAYRRSNVDPVKWLPVPDNWESLRAEWETRWCDGEAGAFSEPLRDVTLDTLATVDGLRDGGVIDLAFPKRSETGNFDTIAAFVRTPQSTSVAGTDAQGLKLVAQVPAVADAGAVRWRAVRAQASRDAGPCAVCD